MTNMRYEHTDKLLLKFKTFKHLTFKMYWHTEISLKNTCFASCPEIREESPRGDQFKGKVDQVPGKPSPQREPCQQDDQSCE